MRYYYGTRMSIYIHIPCITLARIPDSVSLATEMDLNCVEQTAIPLLIFFSYICTLFLYVHLQLNFFSCWGLAGVCVHVCSVHTYVDVVRFYMHQLSHGTV